jgi:hypothetical protein
MVLPCSHQTYPDPGGTCSLLPLQAAQDISSHGGDDG